MLALLVFTFNMQYYKGHAHMCSDMLTFALRTKRHIMFVVRHASSMALGMAM